MYENKLIIHYTHEKRFRSVKRDLHQVYDSIFHNTPAMFTKLIVGNRNRRDTRSELIRKNPNYLYYRIKLEKLSANIPQF